MPNRLIEDEPELFRSRLFPPRPAAQPPQGGSRLFEEDYAPLDAAEDAPPPPRYASSDQAAIYSRMTQEHAQASRKGQRERELYRDGSYLKLVGQGMSPSVGFEFEGSTGADADKRQKDFKINDPDSAYLQPDRSISMPEMDSLNPVDAMRNVTNFLFSDEMGMLGFKWDQEAFTWSRENFVHQVSEHPYSTAFTLASYLVPIGFAWQKGQRVAARGAKLAGEATQALAKTTDFVADAGGVIKAAAKLTDDEALAAGKELAKGKGIFGLDTSLGFQFDDRAKLVQLLANSPVNDGRKLFSDSVVDKLKLAKNADEVNEIVPKEMLNKILLSDFHQERYMELRTLAKQGQLNTVAQKASWKMWQAFGNKYFKRLSEASKAEIDNMDQFFAKAQFGRYLAQAPTRLSKESEQSVYKYWQGIGGRDYDALRTQVGDETALFADTMLGKWKAEFADQAESGFIDQDTFDLFTNPERVGGDVHIPAVLRDTPGFEDLGGKAVTMATNRKVKPKPGLGLSPEEETRYVSTKLGEVVPDVQLDLTRAMSGPTMNHRAKFNTQKAVLDSLDEINTNPRSLLIGGYMKDSMLHQLHKNFRDIIIEGIENPTGKWSQAIISRTAYDALPAYAKKEWMDFEELSKVVPGLAERMERMVGKHVVNNKLDPAKYADMPLIDRAIVHQFFGGEGSALEAVGNATKLFELMTAVHKTARTSLNPASQTSNIVGNLMMVAMRGVNPFSAQFANDAQVATDLFRKLSNQSKKTGQSVESLMNIDNLAELLGENRYITDKLGGKVDVADLLSSYAMRDVIEAQSFDEVEGLKYVNKVLKHIAALEQKNWSDKALGTVAQMVAGIGEARIVKPTLEGASSLYLAGDMVPKMAYAFRLARDGFGHDALVRELGRAMPQYRTVGHLPQKTRRFFLPWITFPAEAARIMKNNMMDRPVQTMMWMQAPAVAQGVVSGLGMGPDFKEYSDIIDAAPPWAVRYSTVLVDGTEGAELLGGVGAAGVGAIAGAALGGARGGAIGAGAGAVAGATLGKLAGQDPKNELREFNRAWVMDWLPQSSLFPQSMHPAEWEKLLPTGVGEGKYRGVPTPGKEVFNTAKDLTPVEPFAVFSPIFELWQGRGSFGEEIEAKSGISFANKFALGLLGHMSPPIMQKYGMKLEGPGGALIPMGDTFEANGGMMTLPKAATATFWGVAASSLAYYGASRLPKSGISLLGSTALAGVGGAMAGAEMNTRRLMTDLGVLPDPRTEEYADHTLDFFANSFFGLNKSWKASPGQALYTDSLRQKRFIELRKGPVKEYADAITSGRESEAMAALAEIKKTYIYEHANTEIAEREFMDWAQRMTKEIQGLPIYAGMSDEQLRIKYAALTEGSKEKTRIHRQMAAEIRAELRQRLMRKTLNTKIVELE